MVRRSVDIGQKERVVKCGGGEGDGKSVGAKHRGSSSQNHRFQAVIKPPQEPSAGTVMKLVRGWERKALPFKGVTASSFVS